LAGDLGAGCHQVPVWVIGVTVYTMEKEAENRRSQFSQMIICLKGSGGLRGYLDIQKAFNPPRLFSYFFLINKNVSYGELNRFDDLTRLIGGAKKKMAYKKLFLDSGAYSAWTKGIVIDIQEYIQFIKQNKRYIEVYSVLDVMGDAEATWRNQMIMERAGLKPLPCFHYGESEKYLERYVDKYPYIALGGMVPIEKRDLIPWLDRLFRDYICGKDGKPKVKVHGFGMTIHELLWRYPWFSVDSASWVFVGRNGGIFVPRKIKGEYNYVERPWVVAISSRSGSLDKVEGKHFNSFNGSEQKIILEYLASKGYNLGEEGESRAEPADYVLKKGERWEDPKNRKMVIPIIDDGAATNYRIRDALNIGYFMDLMDAYNKAKPWPWKFKTAAAGFGLMR
jgi:hypothetical protein